MHSQTRVIHMLRFHTLLLSCVAFLLASVTLQAQTPSVPTVTGTGIVEIKRQPEILRTQIEVMTRGKTLKEAMEKLKTRREEVKAAFVQMGAKKEKITYGEIVNADELSGRQDDINRMVHNRNKVLGKQPEKTESPAILAVMIRVEFALPTSSAEDFLIAAHELQEKVKKADLGGLKERGKLSPEEQEVMEEGFGPPRGRDGPARGEPVFMYISKISEEELSKSLTGAFAKAKRDAERLARAAGVELGGLHRLTNSTMGSGDDDPYAYARRGYNFNGMQMSRPFDEVDDDGAEAVGLQPGKVSLRVSVMAEFTLKQNTNK